MKKTVLALAILFAYNGYAQNKKVSELPVATNATGAAILVTQGGVSKQLPVTILPVPILKTVGGTSLFGTGDIPITANAPTWGTVTGTLSSQTDLQSALNTKQNTLAQGSGINISGNVISATGSGGIAEPIKDTLYYIATGQSNSVGGSATPLAQADTSGNARLQVYDTTTHAWIRMKVGQEPFQNPQSPNAQFFFGRKLVRENPNLVVRILQYGLGASGISFWHNGVVIGRYLNDILREAADANLKKVNGLLWDQGEADNDPIYYKLAWDSVKATFRRQSWFPSQTPIVAIGLPQYASGRPTFGSETVDWAIRGFDGNNDPWDGYGNVDSATVNIGNEVHWDAPGLKYIGEKVIPAALASLPQSASSFNTMDVYRNHYFAGVMVGRGRTAPDYRFPTGTDTLTASNTVVAATGGYSNNQQTSMYFNNTGTKNATVGQYGMELSESANENSNLGAFGLRRILNGYRNTNTGAYGLYSIRGANSNANSGYRGLYGNVNGNFNTNHGAYGLENSSEGNYNTNVGAYGLNKANAFYGGLFPTHNVNIGSHGQYEAFGSYNITIGDSSGYDLQGGRGNVILGSNRGARIAYLDNWIILSDGRGTERATFDDTGNMGIGLTIPTQKLDVAGNIRVRSLASGLTPPVTTGTTKLLVVDANGLPSFINNLVVSGTGSPTISSNFGLFINSVSSNTLQSSSGQVALATNNTNRVVVLNTGEVGINDLAPIEKLSVGGRVFIANQTEPATPTGGGVIYIEGGALKYKGSSGTVTIIGAP